MEKSFTQRVHYRFVVEGDFSVGDMWEEDLFKSAEEAHDTIIEYLVDSPEVLTRGRLELSNLRTEEES